LIQFTPKTGARSYEKGRFVIQVFRLGAIALHLLKLALNGVFPNCGFGSEEQRDLLHHTAAGPYRIFTCFPANDPVIIAHISFDV